MVGKTGEVNVWEYWAEHREVWRVNLPIVKSHKHWGLQAIREVRRLKVRKTVFL